MPIIIVIILAIFCVLIVGTWHYLGIVEKSKKIIFILIGIFVSYLMTIFVFSISKSGIMYPSKEIESMVQNVIVLIFTGLNGILILPYLGRLLDKINEDELTKKQFQKRITILIIAIIVIFILESNYLRGTQAGILDIYQKAINKG